MTLDLFTQIVVTVCGLPAIALMQIHRPHIRRWGIIIGLAGQPAWYAQLVIHDQWGMLPVFVGYTGVWVFGLWNHWIKNHQQEGTQ